MNQDVKDRFLQSSRPIRQDLHSLSLEICDVLHADRTFAHPDRINSLLSEVLRYIRQKESETKRKEEENRFGPVIRDRKTLMALMNYGFDHLSKTDLLQLQQMRRKKTTKEDLEPITTTQKIFKESNDWR